jgi:hypothetical protein
MTPGHPDSAPLTHHPTSGSCSFPVTWGTTLVCVEVVGTRICGPAGICGSVGAGPADCWVTAGRLGWATTRTWGSPAEPEWLTTRAVA